MGVLGPILYLNDLWYPGNLERRSKCSSRYHFSKSSGSSGFIYTTMICGEVSGRILVGAEAWNSTLCVAYCFLFHSDHSLAKVCSSFAQSASHSQARREGLLPSIKITVVPDDLAWRAFFLEQFTCLPDVQILLRRHQLFKRRFVSTGQRIICR